MRGFPEDPSIDATLALLREGYDFIPRRCARLGSDVFRTQLMLRPVLCARGPAAAKTFYADGRFTRRGGMPAITLRLLQDKGSVQLLDGAAHRHRKAMFVDILLDDVRMSALAAAVREEMEAALADWEERRSIDLVDEMVRILTVAGGRWAGLPVEGRSVADRARELGGMVENAGRIGPSAWRALLARSRHERHVRTLVGRIRAGSLTLPPTAPARIVAEHRELAGRPLSEAEAAVEIINLLRPIVAVAWFVGFVAIALARHPNWRQRLAADDDWLEPFVEEVRRVYPFFPFIGGRAAETFEWRGEEVAAGSWMLLDLYGTDHDAAAVSEPNRFAPERRLSWRDQSCSFVPQGGGRVRETHRCPGERATVEIMKVATAFLTRSMTYEMPSVGVLPMNRYPAVPTDGVRLSGIRARSLDRGKGAGEGGSGSLHAIRRAGARSIAPRR
jgi:fatty-acid peroxygenase